MSRFTGSFPAPTLSPGGPLVGGLFWMDDFIQGGYAPNAALSNESLPAAKFSEVADAGEWLVTRDAAPTITVMDAAKWGILKIKPGTSAADFVSCQLNGEAIATLNGIDTILEARIAIDDADDAKWFFGLASTDVTGSTVGPILDGTNDSIGFRNILGNTYDIYTVVEDDTTETATDSGIDLVDNTFVVLQLHVYQRNKVEFWINGNLIHTITTNIPDSGAALTPTFEISSPTGTTATALLVDYVALSMAGVRAPTS